MGVCGLWVVKTVSDDARTTWHSAANTEVTNSASRSTATSDTVFTTYEQKKWVLTQITINSSEVLALELTSWGLSHSSAELAAAASKCYLTSNTCLQAFSSSRGKIIQNYDRNQTIKAVYSTNKLTTTERINLNLARTTEQHQRECITQSGRDSSFVQDLCVSCDFKRASKHALISHVI